MMNKRGILFFLALICCSLTTLACAQEPTEKSMHLMFQGDNVLGVVTVEPWRDDFQRIKIDQATYILLEDASYYRRTMNQAGAFVEDAVTAADIQEGNNVQVKAHGNRISQVVIIEQGE